MNESPKVKSETLGDFYIPKIKDLFKIDIER